MSKKNQLLLFSNDKVLTEVKTSKPIRKVKLDKVSPPLRYPGSKFRASKYILPHLEIEHDEYREPFLGSGAIFFTKQKVEKNWLNDIDKELIITFQVIADKKLRAKLIEKIKDYKPSKIEFDILKAQEFKSKLDIAYRYFVINRTAYSGIMKQPNWGFHEVKSVQPDKWPARILEAANKLEGSDITNVDFTDVINKESDNTVLIFLDPPYYLADQKRAYLHSFKIEDHIRLMECLKRTKHKFCLTYDNCDEVKELYKWANIHEYNWMYHTANSNTTTRKIGKELIITNY
jgi:DNA adenine methylase